MRISLRWAVAVSVAVLAIGFAGGALAAKEAAKKGIVQLSQADLKWHDVPNSPGLQQAEVYKKGAMQCGFTRFPKGTEVPMHTHTSDILGVVISGTFGSTDAEGNGKPQEVGGFQSIPGGFKHTTKCTAAADCTLFGCSPGPFDLKMATAPAGKKE